MNLIAMKQEAAKMLLTGFTVDCDFIGFNSHNF